MALQKFGTYFASYARDGGEMINVRLDLEDDLITKLSIDAQGQEHNAAFLDADDLESLGKLMLKFARMVRFNVDHYDEQEEDF
jgi:hypothetical protein